MAEITGATVTDQDREKEVTVTEAVNQPIELGFKQGKSSRIY
ncbi:MAG: hypothetical protein ACLVJN_07295 [Streptococcus parasanguinis]